MIGEPILLLYMKHGKNHTYYQKTRCSNQKPKILICCDFHFRILDENEDVMFATKLDLFSIRTIEIPIHNE